MLKNWIVVAGIVAGTSLANAHDRWSNGLPVPAWVKATCCGVADVHSYHLADVKVGPDGWVLPDYPKPIPYKGPHVQISQDGEYWAFFRSFPDGSVTPIYCFFAPPQGS